MPGLISDPIANPAGEALGFSNVASQPFQGQDWFAPEKWIGATQNSDVALNGYQDWKTGQNIEPQPRVPAAELNQRYGVPAGFGVSGLSFSSDLPESVAAAMHDAKLAEQRRADAAARAPDGIVGVASRFGAGAVTQLLDPIGALAMMVPMGGEVRGLSLLERGGSALARGVPAGAAITTPFVALHKLYADQYGEDYSAGDALREILMGGVLGGGLHALTTVGGDLIGRAFKGSPEQGIVDADPDIRHGAASEALAAALDERPPQSASVIELAAAVKARDELQRFARYQGGLDEESAAALTQGDAVDQRTAAAGQAADRLAQLRDQHAGFLSDVADAQARLDAATDPITQERLASVEQELAAPGTPAARREDLIAERDMLTQGSRTTPAEDELAAARAQAELQGLQAGADRLRGQIEGAQTAANQAAQAAAAGSRSFRVKAASIEGREALAQSLAARTIMRLAGALKVELAPDEAAALARQALREGRAPADIVASIAGRADADSLRGLPRVNDADAVTRVSGDAHGAASDITTALAARAADDHMAPEDRASVQAAADAGKRAAQPAAVDDGELADLHAALRQADEAGALDDEARKALADIQADRAITQSWLKAVPQAAACVLRGII